MFDKSIQELLHKNLAALPLLVCKKSLRHDIDDLVAMTLPRMKLAVVDDKHTSHAYGDTVHRALLGQFSCTHITLEGIPLADAETVRYVREKSMACDALIAVGSGTINDICKYVSFLEGKPYIVFPTAASMNGYLSANASITFSGYKKTVGAHMPQAVLCDLSIIAAAPAQLSKSGLGDALARPTAQADWLLSHLLFNTPYDETPFELIMSLEPELFDHARGIALADIKSIELLLNVSLLSGLGMTIAGGSYPASQGEHMIAHAYEMLKPITPPPSPIIPPLHGEQIGVTTLTMVRLQEALLRSEPTLRSDGFPEKKIAELFSEQAASEAKKTFNVKYQLCRARAGGHPDQPHQLDASVHDKLKNWSDIATHIEKISIPPAQIESILTKAQAPTTPEALGWNMQDYKNAVEHARFLRDRFTFLDLKN